MKAKPPIAVFVIFVCGLLLFVPYAIGYVWLSEIGSSGQQMDRIYSSSWVAMLYRPAARIESMLTENNVRTAYRIGSSEIRGSGDAAP